MYDHIRRHYLEHGTPNNVSLSATIFWQFFEENVDGLDLLRPHLRAHAKLVHLDSRVHGPKHLEWMSELLLCSSLALENLLLSKQEKIQERREGRRIAEIEAARQALEMFEFEVARVETSRMVEDQSGLAREGFYVDSNARQHGQEAMIMR